MVREGVSYSSPMSVESLCGGFPSELGGPGKSSVPTVGSLYSRMVERLPLSPLVSYWGLIFFLQMLCGAPVAAGLP